MVNIQDFTIHGTNTAQYPSCTAFDTRNAKEEKSAWSNTAAISLMATSIVGATALYAISQNFHGAISGLAIAASIFGTARTVQSLLLERAWGHYEKVSFALTELKQTSTVSNEEVDAIAKKIMDQNVKKVEVEFTEDRVLADLTSTTHKIVIKQTHSNIKGTTISEYPCNKKMESVVKSMIFSI